MSMFKPLFIFMYILYVNQLFIENNEVPKVKLKMLILLSFPKNISLFRSKHLN